MAAHGTRFDAGLLALLTVLWLLPPLWIGVSGEFPLNDDWAYARVVWAWLETGEFERLRWTWIPLVSNAAWGSLFSALFGPGFVPLRVSSLVAGWIGMLGSYGLARRLGAPPPRAAIAAGVVAANPIYLNLSFTFMTDVFFTAVSACACYALVRSRLEGRRRWLALGLACAAIALGSRQPALAIPIGFALVMLWEHRTRGRTLLGWGLLAVAALAPFLVYDAMRSDEASGSFVGPRDFLRHMVFQRHALYDLAHNGVVASVYLGWFLAPIAALRPGTRATRAGSAAAALAGLGALVYFRHRLPLGLNVIYDLGLGPIGVVAEHPAGAPPWLWWGLAALGLFALFHLLAAVATGLWERRGERRVGRAVPMLIAICALYLFVLGVRAPFFDRYLLFVLPVFAALGVAVPAEAGRWRRAAAGALLLALAAFAVAGTRDYIVHMRVRQAALDELTGRGVPAEQIDGGFEFNGLHRPAWASYVEEHQHFAPRGARYVVTLRAAERCAGEPYRYERLLPRRTECIAITPTERASWLAPGEQPYD